MCVCVYIYIYIYIYICMYRERERERERERDLYICRIVAPADSSGRREAPADGSDYTRSP